MTESNCFEITQYGEWPSDPVLQTDKLVKTHYSSANDECPLLHTIVDNKFVPIQFNENYELMAGDLPSDEIIGKPVYRVISHHNVNDYYISNNALFAGCCDLLIPHKSLGEPEFELNEIKIISQDWFPIQNVTPSNTPHELLYYTRRGYVTRNINPETGRLWSHKDVKTLLTLHNERQLVLNLTEVCLKYFAARIVGTDVMVEHEIHQSHFDVIRTVNGDLLYIDQYGLVYDKVFEQTTRPD